MITITDKRDCNGCKACSNVCPVQCIPQVLDEEGFWYPQVTVDDCINCDLCDEVCPELATWTPNPDPITYAAYNRDTAIRDQSSSGGMFTLLAAEVLRQGGAVFGVAFGDDFRVQHIKVDTPEELGRLRGSKYVQSDTGDTMTQVRVLLDRGVRVLYSGTPCQIAGLSLTLPKAYENLLTVDVICHGVPSPMVYERYLDGLADINPSGIARVGFRDKEYAGWNNFSMKVEFRDGGLHQGSKFQEMYLGGFLKDWFIRPSCPTCKYKGNRHGADLTLADYWGIEKEFPEFDDGNGISLIYVNTPKGKTALDGLGDTFEFVESSLERSAPYNQCVLGTARTSPNRQRFFDTLRDHTYRDTFEAMKDLP